jgi:cytochrome c-type biogenesis protein
MLAAPDGPVSPFARLPLLLVDSASLTSHLSDSPLLAIPLLFVGGVLTSLTPCVYPMIPITAAIVGGQSVGAAGTEQQPRTRVVGLTLTYVLGLALVYSLLGLFAGLSGTIFGSVSSNPWALFTMANVLIIAALAMLDVIPVRLPSSLTARAAGAGAAGRYSGAFAMGAVSGLVAAPCSAPVMAAVLTWVTKTHSAVLGFFYLFAFSLGMCTLLVVVGLSSGSLARLPRAGGWMLWVKRFFAVAMIAVGEWYLISAGKLWL